MNRRRFLGAAATVTLGATAVTWPAWLREAFAAGKKCGVDEEGDLAVVSAGYRAAQRAGRPLLCLIIPEEDGLKWSRGATFGELLNHGSDDQLAPLALCEVIACRMGPLRRLVPAAGGGEPLMVLVDTAAVPAAGLRLHGELPRDEDGRGGPRAAVGGTEKDWRKAYEEGRRREDQIVTRRMATVARLVREGVGQDREALERRAAQGRAQLGEEEARRISAALGGSGPVEGADRAPALVALAALEARGPRRAELLGALAASVRARLVKGRVPGTRWAQSSGCATTIEGETDHMVIGCGMGHVPEKSARFLYFFSQTPAERSRSQSRGEPCGTLL